MFLKESSKNALTFPCCQANIAVVKCWNKIQLPSKNRCWLKSLNSTPTEDGYRSEQSFRNLILNFCEFRFARMRVAVCRVDLRYLLLVGVRFWKGIQEAKNNTRNSVCEYRGPFRRSHDVGTVPWVKTQETFHAALQRFSMRA